jgi:hypothetical protein
MEPARMASRQSKTGNAKTGTTDTETARRLAALREKILEVVLVLLARFAPHPSRTTQRAKLLRQHLLREAADRVGIWLICERAACRRAHRCRRHAGECLVTLAQTLRGCRKDAT